MFFLNCSQNYLSPVLPLFTTFPWLFIAFSPDSVSLQSPLRNGSSFPIVAQA